MFGVLTILSLLYELTMRTIFLAQTSIAMLSLGPLRVGLDLTASASFIAVTVAFVKAEASLRRLEGQERPVPLYACAPLVCLAFALWPNPLPTWVGFLTIAACILVVALTSGGWITCCVVLALCFPLIALGEVTSQWTISTRDLIRAYEQNGGEVMYTSSDKMPSTSFVVLHRGDDEDINEFDVATVDRKMGDIACNAVWEALENRYGVDESKPFTIRFYDISCLADPSYDPGVADKPSRERYYVCSYVFLH